MIGELCALLTAALWSCSSLVFSAATIRMGPIFLNVARLIVAVAYLAVLIPSLGVRVAITPAQYGYLALSGIIGLSLGDSFLFKAYQLIGPRIAMLVMSAAPAVAAVLAFAFLDEKLSPLGVTGIFVTAAGISLVVLERSPGTLAQYRVAPAGVLFAFLAAASQGSGLVFAKKAFLEGELNGFAATIVRILASLVVLLPAAIAAGKVRGPLRFFRNDPRSLWLVSLGAFLGPFLGISFSLISVEYTKVGVAATIMALVPVLMLPLVRVLYKEKVNWRAIAGACVAVSGVAILFLR